MDATTRHAGSAPVRPPRADTHVGSKGRTDRTLLFLLVVLNIGSAYTTLLGARQVLPQPMSDVIGLTVQAMLFLTLAGFAARHAPVRKWLVVGVLAGASVYTSFFTYYDQLAGEANVNEALDQAHVAHAEFIDQVYQPTLTQVTQLNQESAELYDQSRREGTSGHTTGVVGFGPVAKKYAAEARNKEVESARLQADMDRLQHKYEYDLEGMAPTAIYAADLAAWQISPDAWKDASPMPERATYVDVEQEVKLLTPYWKVKRGETPALAAILLALLVDGVAILLGTAIHSGGRPAMETFKRSTVSFINDAKGANAAVSAAWFRPGVIEDGPIPAELDNTLRVVVLHIDGKGSDFLGSVYQAIHPETGAFDYGSLQGHTNSSYRIAARMLIDRLRSPKLGWVNVQDGFWTVPSEQYARLTNWLTEHIRQEVEDERELAMDHVEPGERTLRLVLPSA